MKPDVMCIMNGSETRKKAGKRRRKSKESMNG
jgi:hypothetical protein